MRFANGVEFIFTRQRRHQPRRRAQTVLVVKNLAAFTARYGSGLPVAGEYVGALENQGERLQLLEASGEEVLDFSYDNAWYPVTDGLGFSLVIVNELAEPDAWNSATQWRPSGALQGSPGVPDPAPPTLAPILINEVLSRTDLPPPTDSLELFNPTPDAVDLGGWFLSDDFNTPMKFRIPDGTMISAGGFVVFTEADFNPGGLGFAFSSLGDEAWLFSGDAQTNLTGYVHGFRFGAAENGVSFGRYRTSVGAEHFVAQSVQTLDHTNSSPRVGPVVISEIHYHPSESVAAAVTRLTALEVLLGTQDAAVSATADELEFIELQNITSNAVSLFDPLYPANTWRLRGDADFDFPTHVTIAPGATLLVVHFDPVMDTNALAAFRSAYALGAEVPIFGPYSGSLDNAGARVELQKPDAPNGGTVPRVVVDTVQYLDSAPWPAGADGFGLSLQRRSSAAYGNDPANWTAVLPTPGTEFAISGIGPMITLQPQSQTRVAYQNVVLSVSATGSAPLRYQWRFNSANLDGATNALLQLDTVQPQQAGDYQALVYNDVGSVVSSNGTLTLLYPATILAQPQSVTTRPGSNVTFSVLAYSPTGLSYQWQKNGANLAGATGSSLSLANVQFADSAAYTVVVTDAIGSATSAPAILTLLINPLSRRVRSARRWCPVRRWC